VTRVAPVLGGVLLIAACAGDKPAADSSAGYTEPPAYTVDSPDDAATDIRLADVTARAGLDFRHATGAFGEKWMPETMGSGVAFFDYDSDGWPDIFLVSSTGWPGHEPDRGATSRLYRNRGDGTFEDVTSRSGLGTAIYGMGVAAADFDADGDQDLYVTAVGPNHLFRNDGGHFVDVTTATGTAGDAPGSGAPAWSTAAAWLDADRDGWIDLLVCNYVDWTPETDLFTTLDGETKSYATPQEYEGESCRLLHSEHGSRFTDVTLVAGLENHEGKSLGVVVEDFDDDGWPDVAIANDTYQNFLYLNRGDGSFEDRALEAGVAFDEFGRARAGMGIDVADVLNRGELSIAIGNFSNEPVALYTQIDDRRFQDLAGAARLTHGTLLPLTFGLRFADLDLDGFVDLLLGNGHIEPDIQTVQAEVSFAQSPQLFLNDGRGQFVDVTATVGGGFAEPIVGRGIATADYDRDGDLDVLIGSNGGPAKLFRNDLPAARRSWLRIRLAGDAPNRDAIGAVARVFVGDRVLRFSVATSSSYLSQSETNPILAGLGGADGADSVVVRWPGGQVSRHGPLRAGSDTVLAQRSTPRD